MPLTHANWLILATEAMLDVGQGDIAPMKAESDILHMLYILPNDESFIICSQSS